MCSVARGFQASALSPAWRWRRLLSNAAMRGRRNRRWQSCYWALRELGLNSAAAFVALARKIARPFFILLRKEIHLWPNFRSGESGIGTCSKSDGPERVLVAEVQSVAKTSKISMSASVYVCFIRMS